MVVGIDGREAERDGEQTRRLRRELQPRGVGAAHNQCQRVQRGTLDTVNLQEGVEAAQFAIVRERLGARDVVRGGPGLGGDGEDALGRGEEEFGCRIDEATDKPGTGDPIDFGTLASDPGARFRVPLAAQRQTVLSPTGNPVLEIACVYPGGLQSRCRALARLMAVDAIDDDHSSRGQVLAPVLDFLGISSDRADDHSVVGSKGRTTANIDDDRCDGSADRAVQIRSGNGN